MGAVPHGRCVESPDALSLGKAWRHNASELEITSSGRAIGRRLPGRPMARPDERPIGAAQADGAYDGEAVYRAIAEGAPDAEVIIPASATAVMSATADRAPTQHDRYIQVVAERGRRAWSAGLAAGGPLRTSLPGRGGDVLVQASDRAQPARRESACPEGRDRRWLESHERHDQHSTCRFSARSLGHQCSRAEPVSTPSYAPKSNQLSFWIYA